MRHVLYALLFFAFCAAQMLGQSASDQNSQQAVDRHLAYEQWFYQQRTYPFAHLPPLARSNYLRQLDAMLRAERHSSKTRPRAMVQASSTAWTLVGPQPASTVWVPAGDSGRTTALAIDPSNASTIYLGTADGGIWKTIDGGNTWLPLTDTQPSMATGAIAIDPQNPATIYVGTGEANSSGDSYYGAGVLKSTDGGSTWTQIAGPFVNAAGGGTSFGSIAVDPGNSSVVLGGTYSGVYRSADSGQTWNLVLPGGTGYTVIFDPTNPSTAYAAVGAVFGSSQNGVYKSSDAGTTWTRLIGTGSNLLPSQNLGRINLAMDPTKSSTLYASISNCCAPFSGIVGIFKTTDGGANWTHIGNPTSCCDWYSDVLAVDPSNPNVLYAGDGSLSRSTDDGQTWTIIGGFGGAPGLHPDMHAIAFSPGGTTMYVATDGGIFSTTNQGASWNDLNAAISTLEFYPGMSLDPSNLNNTFVGTQDNGTLHYSGNLTWNWVDCGDGGWTAVDPTNPLNVYVNCIEISLDKSTNGGISFFNAQTGINTSDRGGWAEPVVIDPSSPQTLYYGTYRIYQSTNGANSWNAISGDLSKGSGIIVSIAVAPSNSNTVYATTNDGSVQVTTNATAGTTAVWTNVTGTLPNRNISNIAVDSQNPNVAYVAVGGFASGHVFKTTNTGGTWTDISGNLPNAPANDVVIDPDVLNSLYLATDAGVFGTTDGGQTWSTLVTGLPRVVITSLKFHLATRTLRAASHGRSAWDLIIPANTLAMSVSSLSFANQNYQTTSSSQTVTVNWNGRSALAVTSVSTTGDFAQTNNCGSTISGGGSCTISLTFTPTASGVRTGTLVFSGSGIAAQSVTLNGTGLSVFALSSSPTSATVTHPTPSAPFSLTLTPQGGSFSNVITLSCSGLPSQSSCSFNPPSVTPGASPATSQLTITTAAARARSRGTHALGLLLFIPVGAILLYRKKRHVGVLCIAILAGLIASCGGPSTTTTGGGGNQGTPQGTYTVVVTGNGTTDQVSTNLTLTVQ